MRACLVWLGGARTDRRRGCILWNDEFTEDLGWTSWNSKQTLSREYRTKGSWDLFVFGVVGTTAEDNRYVTRFKSPDDVRLLFAVQPEWDTCAS